MALARDAPEVENLVPSQEKLERGLLYCSKSRVQTYLQCPAKFHWKYWCEHRPPGTVATERGSEIHEAFELFHVNLIEYLETPGAEYPERLAQFMPEDHSLWMQWLDPFVGNFLRFEKRRFREAFDSVVETHGMPYSNRDARQANQIALDRWKPIGVEQEFWLGEPPEEYDRADPDYVDPRGPPVGDIPWMGKADLIAPTRSVPGIEGDGVVIIDYKTGTAPNVKYSPDAPFYDEVLDGKMRETEFYGWLAERCPAFDHEVDGVAIYYPKNDELMVGEFGVKERRFDIKRAVLGMQQRPEFEDGPMSDEGRSAVPENFEYVPQNLCTWDGGSCWFYNVCPSEGT